MKRIGLFSLFLIDIGLTYNIAQDVNRSMEEKSNSLQNINQTKSASLLKKSNNADVAYKDRNSNDKPKHETEALYISEESKPIWIDKQDKDDNKMILKFQSDKNGIQTKEADISDDNKDKRIDMIPTNWMVLNEPINWLKFSILRFLNILKTFINKNGNKFIVQKVPLKLFAERLDKNDHENNIIYDVNDVMGDDNDNDTTIKSIHRNNGQSFILRPRAILVLKDLTEPGIEKYTTKWSSAFKNDSYNHRRSKRKSVPSDFIREGNDEGHNEDYEDEGFNNGSEDYGSEEHGSENYGSDEYGSEEYDSKGPGSENYGSEEHGSDNYGSDELRIRIELRDGTKSRSCNIPSFIKHSELTCKIYPGNIICVQKCIMGYRLSMDRRTRKLTCNGKYGKWKPDFSDCK